MTEIQTTLIFPGTAKQVAEFYTSVFDDSEILQEGFIGDESAPFPGEPIVVGIRLGDHKIMLMNGPAPDHSEAAALQFFPQTKDEYDAQWDALADGGEVKPGAWITDKFGFSWNAVPKPMLDGLTSGKPEVIQVIQRVMWAGGKPDWDAMVAALAELGV